MRIPRDLHTCGQPRAIVERGSSAGESARDSTAEVISRFIGSDIYYRDGFIFILCSFLRVSSFLSLSSPLLGHSSSGFLFSRRLSFEYNQKGRFLSNVHFTSVRVKGAVRPFVGSPPPRSVLPYAFRPRVFSRYLIPYIIIVYRYIGVCIHRLKDTHSYTYDP